MRKIVTSAVAILLIAIASPVLALDSGIPSTGMPTASVFSSTLLPELSGVVSWKTLSQVEPVQQGGQMVPKFSDDILALNLRSVRVQGFILPLDLGDQQRHFLLSAVPPHCPFCLPAGPEALVEVMAKKAVAYGIEPVIVSGKFAVIRSDPSGVLYRLTEAEPIVMSAKLP
jgi:hypothetical protein